MNVDKLMINELLDVLKHDEGTGPIKNGNLMMYKDSEDIWTIGYGHNLERGISPAIAEAILTEDITDAIKDCYKFDWFPNLTEARQVVICSMIFNMGLTRFNGFKKTITYIEIEQYENAALEMLDSKWAIQVGPRAKEQYFVKYQHYQEL